MFIEFDDSERKVRVRWWIASFHNQWAMLAKVNLALETAFEKAQIEMPYETYDLRVHIKDDGRKDSQPEPQARPNEKSDENNGNAASS